MITKYLYRPGMTEKQKKHAEEMVKASRDVMQNVPTYENADAAVKAAVKMDKAENLCIASVWKEPEDIGKKYTAVHNKNRKHAAIGGYTEVADEEKIYNLANGSRNDESIDTIEEV